EAVQRIARHGWKRALDMTDADLREAGDRGKVFSPSQWDKKWRVIFGGGPAGGGRGFDTQVEAEAFLSKVRSGEHVGDLGDVGDYAIRELARTQREIRRLRDAKIEAIRHGGVYHVELSADDHELIDWDSSATSNPGI